MVEVKLTIEVKCCYPANSQELFDEIKQALINNSNFDEVHIWGYQDNIDNGSNSSSLPPPISHHVTCDHCGLYTKISDPIKRGEVE